MTKKIAVINDLSGFGKCSLTAAISVLAAMGVQPCPLPTAVLSAQTGYPSYYLDDYTDKMKYFCQEWENMGVEFDGIYTGFVASERQIGNIFEFLKIFHKKETFLLVDPVMGDNGKRYAMFTESLLEEMKKLVKKAQVITPNVTELCLLTDADYQKLCSIKEKEMLLEEIRQLAMKLMEQGPDTVVVTGIHFEEDEKQGARMGNLAVTEEETFLAAFPYAGGSYSGTGDLFASVITGGMAKGWSVYESIKKAGAFIERAIVDSVQEKIPANDGVNYEQYLGMLMK